VAAILFAAGLSLSAGTPVLTVHALDLDGRPLNPFEISASARVVVLLFISAECPISNRYAPDVRRLHDAFASKGVAFWLVYPNPAESSDAIRTHLRAFPYAGTALRDPRHTLVKLSKATVTPEAAVYDGRGQLLYRGRIDDRYAGVGVERSVPTQHDLEQALTDTLAGRSVSQRETQAFGCYISDFVR
jgi:hypothetical protein